MGRLTLYTRDSGVTCYEADLVVSFGSVAEFLHRLVVPGISWHWTSERYRDVSPTSRFVALPEKRPWTSLTEETIVSLAENFAERALDGYGRFIAMVGCARESERDIATAAQLRQVLLRFAAGG